MSDKNQRLVFDGNMDELVEVLEREIAITKSDESKPVLGAYGLGPCVLLAGYEPDKNIAFMLYSNGLTNVSSSFGILLYYLSKTANGQKSTYDVRLIGGKKRGSESTISLLKSRLNVRDDIQMNLVEEDTLGYQAGDKGKTLALDSRTGETYHYDFRKNPNARQVSLEQFEFMNSLGVQPASVIYKPE